MSYCRYMSSKGEKREKMVVGFRLMEKSIERKSRSKGNSRDKKEVRWFWLKVSG